MPNILIDDLPDEVEIEGRQYSIRSDYRTGLRIIMAYEDSTLTPQEKQVVALSNLYYSTPHDLPGAVRRVEWFLNGGQPYEELEAEFRLFAFEKDASLILAAFRQTHGIDLTETQMHWWTFLALFMDLGQDTTFCQLVSLRKRVKTGKASKEEKLLAREMGEAFEVPDLDTRTLEQKDAERRYFELVQRGRAQHER